jgi:hypothetical protein
MARLLSPPPWLLLVFSLPSNNGSVRVNIWRKLKRSGAIALPTSGYLLPNTPDNMERFEWLSAEIRKYKGNASVAQVQSFDGLPDERVTALFTAARDDDYKRLLRQMKSKRTPQSLSAARRKFVEISAIDFFGSSLKAKVESSMNTGTKKGKKMNTPAKVANREYVNRIWLTRHRPGIDRCASAWLIQKFIDPGATFRFGSDPKQLPEAIPYDMFGDVGFGHRGDECTFETLCAEFSLHEHRIQSVAEIVHDADLHDDKFGRSEGAAIDRILKGWAKQDVPDAELLRKGMELFQGLYDGLQ